MSRQSDCPYLIASERVQLIRCGEERRVAARERQPSADVGKASRDPESGFDMSYFGDARYVGWGGGIPVWRAGHVVGAIGVSGLPDESDDVELAELGIAILTASS